MSKNHNSLLHNLGVNAHCYFYAPNFGKVEGAYCFRHVRACVRYKIYKDTVLKFHIWIPHQKIIDTFVSSPEPKSQGEFIVWDSSRRPSVRLCVHTFKHEYL